MVMKIGGMTVIGHPAEEIPKKCEDCGEMHELRPYGKNAAMVCFSCAMKDEANARAMFERQMKGDA